MGLSMFNRLILGPLRFPLVRGQEMPDPVGALPPPELSADSRFMSQGWDKINVIKSPPRKPDQH